ncbi:tubulin--tyrosine ligase-like protein 12 [Trichonephila clavipes]|nr:tubulin--tyrosine ligase-like protein 12 [Trichonephila clavipes]
MGHFLKSRIYRDVTGLRYIVKPCLLFTSPAFSVTLSSLPFRPFSPLSLPDPFLYIVSRSTCCQSGRHMEVLPEDVHEIPSLAQESKIRLYSEYPEVSEHLTNPRFYSTNDKTKAHILWLAERLYDYKSLADVRDEFFYVSQFPSEQVLINKDLLAIVCRRSCEVSDSDVNDLESCPKWLPTTYSLMIELPQFISYFQNREKRHLDNTWICKPFNLARGLDIYISDNLTQIIRLSEIRPMVSLKNFYLSDI